jgi:hypothetical protein
LIGQSKDGTPRKSDTYPDCAATEVLDRYLFRYKHMEREESATPLVKRLFGDLAVLCENVIDADRKYRGDWQSQGRKLTSEFVRETRRAVLYTLSQQTEAIQKKLNLSALIWAGVMASIPAKELLEKETKLLESELRNAYERDAAMMSLPVTTAPSTPTNPATRTEDETTDRRALVNAYIEDVRSKIGKRITRKDIWLKAGYKTRTEFERWERLDAKHPNQAADENFTRILREKPHLK